MAINPGRCGWCNERRSTCLITHQGRPDHVGDEKSRYLCFYCIRENLPNTKVRILKVLSDKFFILHPPKAHSTLIWSGNVFNSEPSVWDKDEKGWKITLPKGEYIALFLSGHKVRHKKKPSPVTPMFGDVRKDLYNSDTK